MRFFSQVVVPRLCDFLLNKSLLARYRRELLAHAHGDVLEIGFGAGLNLPYYPQRVHKLTAVDPNPGMHRLAQKRIKQRGIEVDQQVLGGERLPFEDSRFDCAVSTFTLCSIEDVAQALREVYRVLKSGGKFLFLEHGLSPEPSVQKWQRRLAASAPRQCLSPGPEHEGVGRRPALRFGRSRGVLPGGDAQDARLPVPGRGDQVGRTVSRAYQCKARRQVNSLSLSTIWISFGSSTSIRGRSGFHGLDRSLELIQDA
jgi:SAM-dependent methyltransferase